MPNNLATQLDSLPRMGKDALSALWRQLFQAAPPQQLRRQLMVRILAYRIQEQAHRGLSPSALQRLRQMARALEKDPGARSSLHPPSSQGLASSGSGKIRPTS